MCLPRTQGTFSASRAAFLQSRGIPCEPMALSWGLSERGSVLLSRAPVLPVAEDGVCLCSPGRARAGPSPPHPEVSLQRVLPSCHGPFQTLSRMTQSASFLECLLSTVFILISHSDKAPKLLLGLWGRGAQYEKNGIIPKNPLRVHNV